MGSAQRASMMISQEDFGIAELYPWKPVCCRPLIRPESAKKVSIHRASW
jgi:hypothetical protein